MMTIGMLTLLENNEGLTLKKFEIITYKTGWQVATEGIATTSVAEAYKAIHEFGGTCGVWLSDGVYYIDRSHRVKTKREAMEVGRKCNQISVLNWRTMGLAYC